MRDKLLLGLVAITAAGPLCAQADSGSTIKDSGSTIRESILFNKFDIWYSRRGDILPDVARVGAIPVAMDLQRDSERDSERDTVGAAIRAPGTIRVIDTDTPRVFPGARGVTTTAAPAPTPVSTIPRGGTPAATAAPEMNAGFAASGLTLLLGGVAVLRGRRNRFNV